MKQNIKYIILGIFSFFSLLSLIFYLILSKEDLKISSSNLPTQLSDIINIQNWIAETHSVNQSTNFWVSYLGISNFIIMSGNALWSIYVITLFIFMPISGIVFFVFWNSYLMNFVFKKVRRVELVRNNTILTAVFWILLASTLILFFTGFIIIESFEAQDQAKVLFTNWYGTDILKKVIKIGNKNIVLDSMRLFNILIADSGLGNFKSVNNLSAAYANSMIIIIIIVPIFAFITLTFFSIVISSRTVLYEYNLIGKRIHEIKNWIKFKDIPSKKELRIRYWRNPTNVLVLVTFLLSMIFPAFFPIGFSRHPFASTFIIILSITIIVASFIPSLMLWLKVIDIKFYNYNKYIFIQIIVFFSAGLLWQITIWIVWSNKFIYYDYIPIIIIFLYIISSFISLFMFIRKT